MMVREKTGGRANNDDAARERALRRAILRAYPDRVAVRRAGDAARGVMVGGRGVVLEPSSVVREGALFVALDPRDAAAGQAGGAQVRGAAAGAKGGGRRGVRPGEVPAAAESRVSLASAIEEAWLEELFPHLVARRVVHRVEEARGGGGAVVTVRQLVFVDLVVREDVVGAHVDPEGAAEALFAWLARDVGALFAADEEAARWQARLRFARRHVPEAGLPALDDDAAALRDVLRPLCAGATSAEKVRARAGGGAGGGGGLRGALEARLTWAQRAALDELAPETIAVPSGSRVRVQYAAWAGPSDSPPTTERTNSGSAATGSAATGSAATGSAATGSAEAHLGGVPPRSADALVGTGASSPPRAPSPGTAEPQLGASRPPVAVAAVAAVVVAADPAPILAVRLQEVFGWADTPRLAKGRVPVVMHLLGPNFRPVQVTADLRSFWNTTYAEVRRELRARYPRHPWPEDPWAAPPVAVGGRRQKGKS